MQKIALISDIHGNTPALRATLEDIRRADCTRLFMLGDLINGLDPHGCVELLRGWSETNRVPLDCIHGNAEAYLATPDRDSLPFIEEDWHADMLELMQWYEDHLIRAEVDWLTSLPASLRWQDVCFVHDSPMDRLTVATGPSPALRPDQREWYFHGRGITPGMSPERWEELDKSIRDGQFRGVFCAHTHVPLIRQLPSGFVCNTGSAGAPLDGDPRQCWVQWDPAAQGSAGLILHRVEYDLAQFHALVQRTPDYHSFKEPGFRHAYTQMIVTGKHWKNYMPQENET